MRKLRAPRHGEDEGGSGMNPTELARLKEQLRPVAERLRLQGMDIPSFRKLLEDFRQRPVCIFPFPLRSALRSEVLGLWWDTDTVDYIYYEQDTTPHHQRHIVLHEGSHILRGHQGPTLPELLSRVAPHLDPKLIRSLLCRSVFDETQEAEAEVLATLIEESMDEYGPLRLRQMGDETVERIARFARETR
jgi:hypothetical protein